MATANRRTPEQNAAWNRWHFVVAALLVIALAILWAGGKGPLYAAAGGTCCGGAPAAAAPEVAAAPAPAAAAPAAAGAPSPIPAVNVYFEVDKFDLPADASAKLADIVAYVKAHPEAKVAIVGYNDPTGDTEKNIDLARNRAFAVRDFLMKTEGLPEARFDMEQPPSTVGSGSYEVARRAEVRILP